MDNSRDDAPFNSFQYWRHPLPNITHFDAQPATNRHLESQRDSQNQHCWGGRGSPLSGTPDPEDSDWSADDEAEPEDIWPNSRTPRQPFLTSAVNCFEERTREAENEYDALLQRVRNMEVLVDYSRDYFAREAEQARIERDLLLCQRQQLSREIRLRKARCKATTEIGTASSPSAFKSRLTDEPSPVMHSVVSRRAAHGRPQPEQLLPVLSTRAFETRSRVVAPNGERDLCDAVLQPEMASRKEVTSWTTLEGEEGFTVKLKDGEDVVTEVEKKEAVPPAATTVVRKRIVKRKVKVMRKKKVGDVGSTTENSTGTEADENVGVVPAPPPPSPAPPTLVTEESKNVASPTVAMAAGTTTRTRKVIRKVKRVVKRPVVVTPATTAATTTTTTTTDATTTTPEMTPSPLPCKKMVAMATMRVPRPSSESSEDNFRLVAMKMKDGSVKEKCISSTMQHRHITLTSSKVVVSRGTSPPPTPLPISPGKSLKANREEMAEWWASKQASAQVDFNGQELMKWIQARGGRVAEEDIEKLCESLLKANLLENAEKDGKDEFKADGKYCWSVSGMDNPLSPRPGRIVGDEIWPPPAPVQDARLKYTESDLQLALLAAAKTHSKDIESLEKSHREELETLLTEKTQQIKDIETRLEDLNRKLREYEPSPTTIPEGPPPPPPPPPPAGAPPPPPPPPPGGIPPPPPPPFSTGGLKVRKPKVALKPLFWSKVQLQRREKKKREVAGSSSSSEEGAKSVWEQLPKMEIDCDEVEMLFAKKATKATTLAQSFAKPKPKQIINLLDAKRLQAVGVFMRHLNASMEDIKHGIYNLDLSVLDVHNYHKLFELRGTQDELDRIKGHLHGDGEGTLDEPERFLYELSSISGFYNRLECFLFKENFNEMLSDITRVFANFRLVIDMLHKSSSVSAVMGLVLAIGNYMNAGNQKRGMAEAFALDILPKLKNVKTKDNSSNLLQYVVSLYVKKYDQEAARCPLPDPGDVSQASNVSFEEMEADINKLSSRLQDVERKALEVFQSSPSNLLQPFKATMEEFLGWAKKTIQDQFDFLADCQRRFTSLADFYCFHDNGGVAMTPSEFFNVWTELCADFKEAWKREKQIVAKRMYEERKGTLKKLKKQETVGIKKSASASGPSGLKKMLSSRGPFKIKKRRSTDDFQKAKDSLAIDKLVSVLTDPDST
eukprot:m.14982 g.14982  ORF g.14982 m.14982 type:complete len:1181 (+) comp26071_c0_seq2:219-3761(+)